MESLRRMESLRGMDSVDKNAASSNSKSNSTGAQAKQAHKEKVKYTKYQEFLYWQKRACEARKWANILLVYHTFIQLSPILNPSSETEYYVNSGFMANSVLMSLLSFNTYSNPARLQKYIFIILLDMHIRTFLSLWDFDNVRDKITTEFSWEFNCILHIMAS
jgi:hypothetical protein